MTAVYQKKKKTIYFPLIVGGIIGIIGLVITIFLVKNSSSFERNKDGKPTKYT